VSQSERVVVAGAGLAGFRTVEELRRRGYAGRITLIGAEDRPPYDRPPLSKRVLAEGAPFAGSTGPSLQADFAALGVDFRPGETAAGLEAPAHGSRPATLVTDHDKYVYDHLVVTTGAIPVTLPGPGPQRFLRTYDDALALRALLRPGLRLAIVGAGWIGAEVATAAVAAGCEVTVIEAGPTPLAAALGAEAGARTARWYEPAGVELRTGTAVESVQPGGLALAGGGWLAADEVVTAVGVRPAVGWLAGSGVLLDNGVAVDAGLRASLPGVYAAGDCAAFESRLFGARLRVEHWDVALHAPEVVAANILGGAETFDPVPYVWSEQFGRMLQYAGHHDPGDRLVWRGDPEAEKWSACWLSGSRLVAVLAVGRPRDLLQGRRLIADRAAVDPARLADPEVAVKAATA
jgi:3-phenylpropionate/trans-cinnamate dioxygenase ferredoxin reductase component